MTINNPTSRSYERTKRSSHLDVERELDSALNTVLFAVKDEKICNADKARNMNHRLQSTRDNSGNITAGNILPGASTLEDINMYIHAAKKEKMEQLKKKMPMNR